MLSRNTVKKIGSTCFFITQIGFAVVAVVSYMITFTWLPVAVAIILATSTFLLECMGYYVTMTLKNSHEYLPEERNQLKNSLKSNIFITIIIPVNIMASTSTFTGSYTIFSLLITSSGFSLSPMALLILAIIFSTATVVSSFIYNIKISRDIWNIIRMNNDCSRLSHDNPNCNARIDPSRLRNSGISISPRLRGNPGESIKDGTVFHRRRRDREPFMFFEEFGQQQEQKSHYDNYQNVGGRYYSKSF